MEFTESFPITQSTSSNHGQIVLSPSSRHIAISEFYSADRRIGTSPQEVLPAWSVRIVETDTLSVIREFHLKLPLNLVETDDNNKKQQTVDYISSTSTSKNKRQFVMGGLAKPSASSSSSVSGNNQNNTLTSPLIGSNLMIQWSPDGKFVAAWPQDTALIFILCPYSTGYNTVDPLLRIQELVAVGISTFKWTPDSRGLLVSLKYGMGIKYWRLDCKNPVHLFPYPKSTSDSMVFSHDGVYLAILHRRDGVDHIAIYSRLDSKDDWKVLQWLNVPEDVNLEGISFAKFASSQQEEEQQQIPHLYAWESISKFQFLVYDGNGKLKCHVTPEIFSSDCGLNCSFGIRNWKWSLSGRLAVFSDSQEAIYLWNAVNQKLMNRINLNQLEFLKSQNPIVFREQHMRESSCVKYEASYTFPLQSQLITGSSSPSVVDESLRYELSFDGEYLALHHPIKYSNCVWIFDLKQFKLKAMLLQLRPIQDFCWHSSKNVLTCAIGSDHVYFWQPDGTHCIPYPSTDSTGTPNIKSIKWMKNQRTILMNGNKSFCLGIPEIL